MASKRRRIVDFRQLWNAVASVNWWAVLHSSLQLALVWAVIKLGETSMTIAAVYYPVVVFVAKHLGSPQ